MDLTADAINGFLSDHATDTHIEAVHPAIKKRRETLDTIRLSMFKVGDEIVTDRIKPKYLAGLRGTLTQISPPGRTGRQKAVIRLDEDSTNRLRKHEWIPEAEKEHEVDYIPLAACFPAADPAAA